MVSKLIKLLQLWAFVWTFGKILNDAWKRENFIKYKKVSILWSYVSKFYDAENAYEFK